MYMEEILTYYSIILPVFSLIPSISLPDVQCAPSDLIWRKGTLFEAMTGRSATLSDGLLAEVFWGVPQLYGKCQEICAQPLGSFNYHDFISDLRD